MTSQGKNIVNIDDLYFEALDDQHDLRGFTCGNSSIDLFFQNVAHYDQALGLSQTTVVIYHEQVIGFYSAKCTKITIDLSEVNEMGVTDWHVPAIEVPYLGVHKDWQKRGVGKEIVDYIIAEVTEIAERVGCKFLFLQALNDPDLIKWYEKMKFRATEAVDYDANLVPMRMPILQRYNFPEY